MANKNKNANLKRIFQRLEPSLNASLARVLAEAHSANVISCNHKFRQIFLNRLAEDLWHNNSLYPDREQTSICNMPFVPVSNDTLRSARTFSSVMSQNQAAIIIQVFIVYNSDHGFRISN